MPIRSRLHLTAAVALTAAAVAVTGCIPSGTPESQPDNTGDNKTITLMNWEALEGSPFEQVFQQFTKDTGIKIEYQFAASGSDYWPKTRTVLGSNNPPDLMRIDDDFLPYYASTGKLQDLTANVKASGMNEADYYESVFKNTTQPDGKIVGWSLGIQPRMLFYNKDMFTEAGVPLPPTTWTGENWTQDDFLAAAKKLSIKNERWGASVMDDSPHETIYPVNNGGNGRWSPDGKSFALAEPEGQLAIQWVADLTCKHDVQPKWSELQQDGRADQLFAAGQLGMVERSSSFVNFFRENVTEFEWDVAPVPAGTHGQQTQGNQLVFAIPTAAANKDAAWKLLEYLTTTPGATAFAEEGTFVPGLKSASEAAVAGSNDQPPAHPELIVAGADNAYLSARVKNIEEAIELYRPGLDPVKNCQAKASEVLPELEPQVNEIINRD